MTVIKLGLTQNREKGSFARLLQQPGAAAYPDLRKSYKAHLSELTRCWPKKHYRQTVSYKFDGLSDASWFYHQLGRETDSIGNRHERRG